MGILGIVVNPCVWRFWATMLDPTKGSHFLELCLPSYLVNLWIMSLLPFAMESNQKQGVVYHTGCNLARRSFWAFGGMGKNLRQHPCPSTQCFLQLMMVDLHFIPVSFSKTHNSQGSWSSRIRLKRDKTIRRTQQLWGHERPLVVPDRSH